MRKTILLTMLLLVGYISFGQYNTRPSRSRFYNSKYSTFIIKKGDLLGYSVSKDTSRYDITVSVKNYGRTIDFSYSIPDSSHTANVSIPARAVQNAIIYDTLLNGADKSYNDTSVFWLSRKNYSELAAIKETTMDLGDGKETFKRQTLTTAKLNFKGREKIVTVFLVQNTNAKFKKRFLVLTDENNPLIVQMESGWLLRLKEVR